MVDMAAISAAITSLRTAGDMAKGFLDLKEFAALQSKSIELQSAIMAAQTSALAAQSDQMALIEELRAVKAALAHREAWDAERSRYRLMDYGANTFAYELTAEAAQGEPIHRLCPACFQAARKSILQFQFRTSAGQDKYFCAPCKAEYHFGLRKDAPRGSVRPMSF